MNKKQMRKTAVADIFVKQITIDNPKKNSRKEDGILQKTEN